MVPPLTEGQQATLTCTAPGLCSGSPPTITWITSALKTDNLTAVTQRHSSTLTFKPSAKHHNTNVICKVSFPGNITTEESVSLNISCKYVFYLNDLDQGESDGSWPDIFKLGVAAKLKGGGGSTGGRTRSGQVS
uniref:Ig-like domain-containing protein n=1 Tax=Poecilia mexicana TaxID=48701 RepID=A0A3B3Y9L0_9TELE